MTKERESNRRDFLTGAAALGGLGALAADDGQAASEARKAAAVNPRLFTFSGGAVGKWAVLDITPIVGDTLPMVERLDVVNGNAADGAKWVLRGVTSNERYVIRTEKEQLVKKQAALGRPEATYGALIPIKKNAKWWALTQDERRDIFEAQSRHIGIGLKYLPAVARRLHHCRDLGDNEPFDFLTFFDFAKSEKNAFDDLLAALRATAEWKFVEREVDIRLELSH